MRRSPTPKRQILDIARAIRQAAALHRQGKLNDAQQLYEAILLRQPDHFDALHLLGVLRAQHQRPDEAVTLISRALEQNPGSAEAHFNLGNVLAVLGRQDEAISSYDRALSIKPDYADALFGRGTSLSKSGRHDSAIASFDQALAIRPDDVDALYSRGNALLKIDRHREAVECYDHLLTIRQDHAEALNNRGVALARLDRCEEAMASYDRALAIRSDHVDALNNRGTALARLNRHDDALISYDRLLAIRPDHAGALYKRGLALHALGRNELAVASYDQTLALDPHHADALNNRGIALQALGRHKEAIRSYNSALAVAPNNPAFLNNRANALVRFSRYWQAIKDYEKAIAIDLDYKYARGAAAYLRARICDWTDRDAIVERLTSEIRLGRPSSLPFPLLGLSDNAEDQHTCATIYARHQYPAITPPMWDGERYSHGKIRVAYLSGDFREHATAYLMAGLFDRHDKTRFEIIGISFGPQTQDQMTARLRRSFDRFIDARLASDCEVAKQIREWEIDIAVDLKGYTQDARPGILAYRPAPVQVNYLGYPSTMGADYIDYIVADRLVIPPEHAHSYTEKVVYLPDCYQINDSERRISDQVPSRSRLALPEDAFVFCSFNNHYKITPDVFDVWMRLLHAVDGSVLWLMRGNALVQRNLLREAADRGIAPERIVFAPQAPLADHLSRYRQADLFLDTLPCNAHTTASDALWAGLPVLTCLGTTFAGRVAASLLTAIGLPELVTHSMGEYEALALELATDPALLRETRDKLARNRQTAPLFDTDHFRSHIEAAYTTMWEIKQRGEPPQAFAVPAGAGAAR